MNILKLKQFNKYSLKDLKKYFSLSSLVTRAAIFTILICSIPVVFVGWYLIDQTVESLTQSAIEQNNKVAERIASDLSQYMLSRKNFLMVTSGKDEIRSMQPETMQKFLLGVRPYYGGNEAFAVSGADGQQVLRTDSAARVNVSDREYFKQAMQGILNFSEPLPSKINNSLTIMGAAPINGTDGQIKGVLVANISLQNIQIALEQILAQNPGYITMVIDKNRVPIFHQSDLAAVQERKQLEGTYYQEAVDQKSGHSIGMVRGQEYLISYRPVNNTDWTVLSLYPKETALQATYAMVDHSIKVTLVLIIVFVFIGLFVTRQALLPLRELVAGVKMIEQGDLTYNINTKHKDEFGYVANAFANMTESLRQIVQSVKQTSSSLLESSGHVSAAAAQASAASSQVTNSIQDIAGQITKQTTDTMKTETLIQGLVDITGNVSGSISHVAAATDECSTVAAEGQDVIHETIDKMQSIKGLVSQSAHTVEDLSQSASKIEQITEMITSIAKQTNLLALNAAIEAARAGDAGRGFAVVAEEVRKLAEQAATSTSSISAIIMEIQAESAKAVNVMQQSLNQVEQGVEIVEISGEAFAKIVEAIQKTQHQANTITSETVKQVELCNDARMAIISISNLAEQNTRSAEEIAAVSEEQAASAQDITQAIDKLKNMSHQLDNVVAKFKV